MALLKSINPANGEVAFERESMTPSDLIDTIESSHVAHTAWARQPIDKRCNALMGLASLIDRNKASLAIIATREMGKPLPQSIAELEKCAELARYYATKAPQQLADVTVSNDSTRSFYCFRPLGVILAIMPWNFPFWQVFRAAIPAIIAGNGMALKHASNVQLCAQEIERLFDEAGFPKNLFVNLAVRSDQAAFAIAHPRVQGITLTGSAEAGKIVAAQAGTRLIKTVMELGGNDPFIVLADADIKKAARSLVAGRMLNCGQSCISPKRAIVSQSIKDEFIDAVSSSICHYTPSDPEAATCRLGPMASIALRDTLDLQVQETIRASAKLIKGGAISEKEGAWYEPALIIDPPLDSPAARQELFGPTIAIMTATDDENAINLANDTEFGLGASLFTADLEKAETISRERLYAGSVFINDFVKSDPSLPFGGIKQSGYGRELGELGIREFTNAKTIVVK